MIYKLDSILWNHSCLSVPLPVGLSVCLSALCHYVFSRLDHYFFPDIVHDDSWPWHLVNDGARFFVEIACNDSLQQFLTSSKGKLGFFCHSLKFGSLVSLEIVYNDSLQQCLLVKVKYMKINFWAQIWVKLAKIWSKIKLFAIFSSLMD